MSREGYVTEYSTTISGCPLPTPGKRYRPGRMRPIADIGQECEPAEMRLGILALLIIAGLSGCHPGWQKTDEAFLRECWGATRQSDGAYELRFEAIALLGAVEGGIYARSRSCPDHRLGFSRIDAVPDRQLDPVRASAFQVQDHFTVIRGVAVVSPLERRHEHFLAVRIIQFPRFEIAPAEEARRFARDFHLD